MLKADIHIGANSAPKPYDLTALTVSSLETSLSETFSESSDSSTAGSGSWSPPAEHKKIIKSFNNLNNKNIGSTDSVDTITLSPNSPQKPSLLRKKSGDIVKSSLKLPSLARCQSTLNIGAPLKKSVSFALRLEKVKMFDGTDSPSAVSSPCASPPHTTSGKKKYFSLDWPSSSENCFGTSSNSNSNNHHYAIGTTDLFSEDSESSEDEEEYHRKSWEISSTDIPTSLTLTHDSRPVFLKSLQVSPDKKSLFGFVMVKNLSFEKKIYMKLTTNNWKSSITISNSTYVQSFRHSNYDQFKLSMPLSSYKNFINMELVIKYEVGGNPQDTHWDNNDGKNYHLTIKALPPIGNSSHKNSVPEFEDLVNRLVNVEIKRDSKYDYKVDENDKLDSSRIPRLKSSFSTRYNFNNTASSTIPARPVLKTSYSNSDISNIKPRYSNSYKAKQQQQQQSEPSVFQEFSKSGTESTSSDILIPSTVHKSEDLGISGVNANTNINSKSYSDLIASMCFYKGEASSLSTSPQRVSSSANSSSTALHCNEQDISFQNYPIGSRLSSASAFHSFSDSIHI